MIRSLLRPRSAPTSLLFIALLALAACTTPLIETPYVMVGPKGREIFAQTDPAFRTSDIPILYVTDRAVDRETERGPYYGYKRSKTIDFGVATVGLSPEPTWDQLVADSTSLKRSRGYDKKLTKVEKLGEWQSTISWFQVRDGGFAPKEGVTQHLAEEQRNFEAALDRWLEHTDRKEAIVYVHGFANSFQDAIFRLSESWHFGGRKAVPIVFTWPAGSGGLLRGYTYDRESGEFAVVHLKMLLYALAKCPKIEKVHLISHSRGTDVATTALRELNAEIRGITGRSPFATLQKGVVFDPSAEAFEQATPPWKLLKLETLVLASPDLDLDVFIQRFFGENVIRAAHHVAIYFSKEDNALWWAEWLFEGRRRLGALHVDDIPLESRELLAKVNALQLINCDVHAESSHSYLFTHPAAFSDLLLLIRDDREPGAENGRPLGKAGEAIWELPNDYLKKYAEEESKK
ncbi:MAG TPA: alpha/beta hydrolase [Phycisphaerales bacterium]|nr:alpha/beta hydrolase [Phycisphaerales bacterium]